MSNSATPCTVDSQASLSMEFSRQEYWSGSPWPSPGDLPNPGIEPWPLALAGRFFTTCDTWEAQGLYIYKLCKNLCLSDCIVNLFTYIYFHKNIFVAHIVFLALITIVTLISSHWKNYIFSTFVAAVVRIVIIFQEASSFTSLLHPGQRSSRSLPFGTCC